MIHEVDEAVESFLEREVLNGSGVEVVFDAPTKEWASRRTSPTIDVYLYDIREDANRRQVGTYETRDEGGGLVARTAPARFFKLSYLVTAWTQRPIDEHRLLATLLTSFLCHKVMPERYLVGSIEAIKLPLLVEIAKPPPENRQISEVWSALGGELKASLDLVLTAPVSAETVPVTAPLASRGARIRATGDPGQESERSYPRPVALPEVAPAAASGSRPGAPARRRRARSGS